MLKENSLVYTDCIQNDFDRIYLSYFYRLHRFAKEYVMSDADAENIVQDVFLLLWEKREVLNIQISLTAYLFSLVKNKCIDHLRHRVIANEFQQELSLKLASLEELDSAFVSEEEIERFLSDAINKLPERCREIFIKSRIEGKKYREIAEELNISVNTVENQIAIALRKLRIELKDYLPLLLFFTVC
ncbi:MAG: RNA polymerase sigma-70 factor [Tannerellaceae bacterium]|jgi:RNA polymerase sigma-70 factor (ECF subfamily)|nr:RNA polymerase sigma-70 factor [Tannerellaceae bacterium]